MIHSTSEQNVMIVQLHNRASTSFTYRKHSSSELKLVVEFAIPFSLCQPACSTVIISDENAATFRESKAM